MLRRRRPALGRRAAMVDASRPEVAIEDLRPTVCGVADDLRAGARHRFSGGALRRLDEGIDEGAAVASVPEVRAAVRLVEAVIEIRERNDAPETGPRRRPSPPIVGAYPKSCDSAPSSAAARAQGRCRWSRRSPTTARTSSTRRWVLATWHPSDYTKGAGPLDGSGTRATGGRRGKLAAPLSGAPVEVGRDAGPSEHVSLPQRRRESGEPPSR